MPRENDPIGFYDAEMGVSVDYWARTKLPPSVWLHILSHCHADHMLNLSDAWPHSIFCSPTSKRILRVLQPGIDQDRIVALEPNETHYIQPLNCSTDSIGSSLNVTFIDAHHCPGSIMVIIEDSASKKSILYTGDFRYELDDAQWQTCAAHRRVFDYTFSRLYFDNTLYKSRLKLMPRHKVTADIIAYIESQTSSAHVFFGIADVGKEELLLRIAQHFQVPVDMSHRRYKITCAVFGAEWQTTASQYFCETGQSTTWLHAVPRHKLLDAIQCCPKRAIGILPSALALLQPNSAIVKSPLVTCFPYSDHSSHAELQAFLQKVKAHRLYPFASYAFFDADKLVYQIDDVNDENEPRNVEARKRAQRTETIRKSRSKAMLFENARSRTPDIAKKKPRPLPPFEKQPKLRPMLIDLTEDSNDSNDKTYVSETTYYTSRIEFTYDRSSSSF